MYRFFIRRPIVAIVIAIITVIIGLVAMAGLPVAQYPNIVPPEILIQTTYVGADALAIEQSVATPLEQQMSGVDNMNYMFSLNPNNGLMRMTVNFDVKTDPNTDQVLAQLRESQAERQLPIDVRNFGVTVQKSLSAPLMLIALYSPKGTYDATFLANYAYINIIDQLTRVKGIASVTVFGAGQYAMRCWVRPDMLAKLNITIPEIVTALQKQNTVNPAGQVGGEPSPPGQEFTYAIRAQGRLVTPGGFRPDRPARQPRRLPGPPEGCGPARTGRPGLRHPRALQRPAGRDSGALPAPRHERPGSGRRRQEGDGQAEGVLSGRPRLRDRPRHHPLGHRRASRDRPDPLHRGVPGDHRGLRLPPGVAGDAHPDHRRAGVAHRHLRLFPAAWLFHQSDRPHGDGGGHRPGRGRRHRRGRGGGAPHRRGDGAEGGRREGDEEVAGPVMAIALVLAAVFLPTVFIPGITGRLYTQFAVTIAISVLLSAFNALTLSPALCALLLRPKKETRGPLGWFYRHFNRIFKRATKVYVTVSGAVIRKAVIGFVILAVVSAGI